MEEASQPAKHPAVGSASSLWSMLQQDTLTALYSVYVIAIGLWPIP